MLTEKEKMVWEMYKILIRDGEGNLEIDVLNSERAVNEFFKWKEENEKPNPLHLTLQKILNAHKVTIFDLFELGNGEYEMHSDVELSPECQRELMNFIVCRGGKNIEFKILQFPQEEKDVQPYLPTLDRFL